MSHRPVLLLAVWVCTLASALTSTSLIRHRRFLLFPEGASYSVAVCLSNKARVIADSSIYTEGVAWGASFDLPNSTQVLASAGAGVGPPGAELRRRKDRAELYRRVERAVDSAGLDGHACVLRAVCETDSLLGPRTHLIMEMLRVALAMPLERLTDREPLGHREYIMARQNGLHGVDCGALYPDCPVSLLSLALALAPTTL